MMEWMMRYEKSLALTLRLKYQAHFNAFIPANDFQDLSAG